MTIHLTVREVLVAARALIEDPEYWCQGDLAQDNLGLQVSTMDENAYCFCALGALYHAAGVDSDAQASVSCYGVPGYSELEAAVGRDTRIAEFNDEHEHADVLALYDRALTIYGA